MAHPIAAASRLSGPPACVLLDEFASVGIRRNATTASSRTSAGHVFEVTFTLVDPPGLSPWFIHYPGLKNSGLVGRPQILNATDSLVVMHLVFCRDGRLAVDYFVYRAGPGTPSLRLIPGPCPDVEFPHHVGVLPSGAAGEHYHVVFPVRRLKPRLAYEIHVFSSESQAWSAKAARVSDDPETRGRHLLLHEPSKAIATGGSSLAWVDLWQGVVLCNVLDEDPVLRMIRWPVPPSVGEHMVDGYLASSVRDATLRDGVIRFVEVDFGDDAMDMDIFEVDFGRRHRAMDIYWKATVWKRDTGSKDWDRCLTADIAKIVDTTRSGSGCSHLLRMVWDDASDKLDIGKVSWAAPVLSLSDEDVVYFVAGIVSRNHVLVFAINVREERLEELRQNTVGNHYSAWSFSSFLDTNPDAGAEATGGWVLDAFPTQNCSIEYKENF
ncbi:hypothetical protein ACP70R_016454 [Stipagrostis hirtigluma subsp. patula]